MIRCIFSLAFTALLCMTASSVARSTDILDPGFSMDGIEILDSGQADYPLVSCPGALGTRMVVSRIDGSRIRTIRLIDNGELDRHFGTGGVTEFDLATYNSEFFMPALCRPDGSAWIVARIPGSNGDNNLRIFAVSKNGVLIPGFAGSSNGVLDVDLDLSMPGLGDLEEARSIQPSPDGGALIVGHVTLAKSPDRPFLIKLAPSGAVERVAFPMPTGLSYSIHATAVAVGPGGGIWIVGDGYASGTRAYRMYVDPSDYSVARTEIGAEVGVIPSSGVLLRSGVMVVGARQLVPGNNQSQPRLLVYRTNGSVNMLTLPQPAANSFGLGLLMSIQTDGATVAAVDESHVFLAAQVEVIENDTSLGSKGWYFSRAQIGATPGQDRVDTAFSAEGRATLAVTSGNPACGGLLNGVHHVEVGIWNLRPFVLGWMSSQCFPEALKDGVLIRLRSADVLFRNGFDRPALPQ